MVWTKESNPHTQGTAPAQPNKKKKGKAKKERAKKTAAPERAYYHKGIKQVGDAALYGDNPEAYYTQFHIPVNAVGPGDIVDDVDPAKRYTFYLFEPTTNADSARELDRLRRSKWFKCEAPRFISPTGKFETRDGVLVLGLGIWYACPMEQRKANRNEARKDLGPRTVAEKHAALADKAKDAGMSAEAGLSRTHFRGQRL